MARSAARRTAMLNYLKRNSLAHIILLAAPLVMLAPALLPGKTLLPAVLLGRMVPWQGMAQYPDPQPWSPLAFDGIAQFYPWRLLASNTWHSGYVPLWNPYQFCGAPLLANDQSAVLYPLNLIYEILPVDIAFGWSALLHLFLTGALLYGYLIKRLGMRPALLGALIWQLSSWQISWLALPTFLCTSAWFPAALLAIDSVTDKPSARNIALLGLVGAMILLAGHLQIALYGIGLSLVYALARLFGVVEKTQRGAVLAALIGSLLLAAVLCAPQILPTLELSRLSHRAADSHPTMDGYKSYVALAMPPERLATLLAPSLFGRNTDYLDPLAKYPIPYPETAAFVSVAGFILAFIATLIIGEPDKRASNRVKFWIALAVISLLFAIGSALDMLTYFGIPGFAASGSPARILVVWTLTMAILAAHGLEWLNTAQTRIAKTKIPVFSAAGILLLFLMLSVLPFEIAGPEAIGFLSKAAIAQGLLLMAITAGLSLFVAKQPVQNRTAWTSILIFACVADLFAANYGFNLASYRDQVYPATQLTTSLQRLARGGRIMALNVPNAVYVKPGVLPPNAATVYGLYDISGYDSLQTKGYKALLNTFDRRDSSPLANGNMTLVFPGALRSLMPELAVAQLVTSMQPSQAAPPNGGNGAYIYAMPSSEEHRRIEGDGTLIVTGESATRISITATDPGDMTLYDQNYPGWRATVNEHPADLIQNGVIGKTVSGLHAGDKVTIAFQPMSFRFGLYLACFGLIVVSFLLVGANQVIQNAAKNPS